MFDDGVEQFGVEGLVVVTQWVAHVVINQLHDRRELQRLHEAVAVVLLEDLD